MFHPGHWMVKKSDLSATNNLPDAQKMPGDYLNDITMVLDSSTPSVSFCFSTTENDFQDLCSVSLDSICAVTWVCLQVESRTQPF